MTSLALATAAAFTGAAAYINWSEQPARLALDDVSLLKAWKPSYAKGFEMQATLALVSGLLGLAASYVEGRPVAAIGGLLMLANWPYTLIAIEPTNKLLGAMADRDAGPHSLPHSEVGQVARRTFLGFAATCTFLFAIATT